MQSPGAGRAAQLMSEPEPGCTQLDRRACTNASRPPYPVVSGHAAICTILRNTAGSMARLRVAVEAVGALFERHTFLAVESGSTDGTRQALRKWQRAAPARVELILPSGGKPHHGYWRNRYLERVLAKPHKYRYMVVLDGDMPWLSQPEVGLSGIRDSLLNHDGLDWAAFVANGVNHYDGAPSPSATTSSAGRRIRAMSCAPTCARGGALLGCPWFAPRARTGTASRRCRTPR